MPNARRPCPELFEASDGRCVYCGMDLLQDFEHFALATTDTVEPWAAENAERSARKMFLCCEACQRRVSKFDARTPLALQRQLLARADPSERAELQVLRKRRHLGWSSPKRTFLGGAVLAATERLVAEFQELPQRFLTETDLQAQLFANLRAAVDRYALGLARGPDAKLVSYGPTDCILTNYQGMQLVCLDPVASLQPTEPEGSDAGPGLSSLPVFAGFEVVYCTPDNDVNITACRAASRRLSEIRARGKTPAHAIVLGFVMQDSDVERFLAGAVNARVSIGETLSLDVIYVVGPQGVFRIDGGMSEPQRIA